MLIPFAKYQATGNDFVIIDNRNLHIQLTTQQVAWICNRRLGIGADGMILIEESKKPYDIKMIFFNADGNETSLCGNGSRALIQYIYQTEKKKKEYHFLAIDGAHHATITDQGWVKIQMQDITNIQQFDDHYILNTGSPHWIQWHPNINDLDLITLAKKIRYNDTFKKEGINVNIVQQIKEDTIFVRTYERGVEDETLSCGTGVTASALILGLRYPSLHKVHVQTKGGTIYVHFSVTPPHSFKDIFLEGPAKHVFNGHFKF